jgi:parallel beta-helix repeat protein
MEVSISFFKRELAHPAITWKVLESHSRHLYDSLERINMKNLKRILTTITLALVALVATQPALASIIRVPSEETTIGAAITSATYGDTILVAAGTYSGTGSHDLDFGGNNIVLMSEDGPEVTIVDGLNTYRIFNAGTSEWRTTRIQGFTFRNGQRQESWGLTGMVKLSSSAWVNFDNMIFEGGAASNGAVMHITGGARGVFTDCIFRNNTATNKGAVYLEQGSGEFNNCLFENNTALEGAALHQSRGSVVANNCTFRNNNGGVIFAYWNSSVNTADCVFQGNTGLAGVAVRLQNASSLTMTNCLVTDNIATNNWTGGVIAADDGGFDLTGCTFANNTCADASNGAVDDRHDNSTITNCVIWGTKVGMGTVRCETVSCSLIFGNEGGDTNPCIDLTANGNFQTDPGFCDPDNRDYRIASNSPCLPAFSGACGLIGATGNGGCTLVATEALNFGSVKAMYR